MYTRFASGAVLLSIVTITQMVCTYITSFVKLYYLQGQR